MNNRRTAARHPASIQLNISDLFRYGENGIHGLDTSVEVENISHSGLCFMTECILPVGYYFKAAIQFPGDSHPPVLTTLKIVRVDMIDRIHYLYGCEFIDLPEEVYRTIDACFSN